MDNMPREHFAKLTTKMFTSIISIIGPAVSEENN